MMTTQTKTTWRKVKLGEVMKTARVDYEKVKTSDYKKSGRLPIFDQGSDFIAGYTNNPRAEYKGKSPAILFGDHTLKLKIVKPPFAVGTDGIQILEPNGNLLDRKFFYYALKGLKVKSYGYERHMKYLRELDIDCPVITDQKRIADILSAFDDKIELNNKISRTLEQMAQAIFKEWLFKNQNSNIKNQKLGDLMVLRKEKFKKYEDWKNLKLLDLGRFPQKSLAITSYGKGEEIKTAGIKFKKGDILFGAVRPYFHKVVIASFDGVTNSSVFVIIPKKDNYYTLLITMLFSENTVNYASMSASGTKMPVIKWEVLCDMEISLPEERVLNNFNKIVGNFYKVILKNAEENQKLAALRDLLLPKLMSGEIKV